MEPLRQLVLPTLPDAVSEAQDLLARGYVARGNWSLAQICRHLRVAQDSSIDGYPAWTSLFAMLRPLMRRTLLPRAMSADPPRGIRTLKSFQPESGLDDATELHRFVESADRFRDHPGTFHAHPAFGRLDRIQLEQLHAAHAAHHLRFLEPNAGES